MSPLLYSQKQQGVEWTPQTGDAICGEIFQPKERS